MIARFLLLGLAVLLLVILLRGLDVHLVLTSLRQVGWLGFAAVVVGGLGLTACLASGLYPLLAGTVSPPLVFAARQVRDSAGDILPFTQIGGIALGMRVLSLGGVAPSRALAAGMVDVTTELMAQALFILTGLALAAPAIRADPHLGPYFAWLVGGAVLFAIGTMVFVVLQLAGSRLAEKLLAAPKLGRGTTAFREVLHHLYRQRARIALSLGLHFLGWCASGLWLWLVFQVLGKPIAPASAVAIQSLLEALRSATVFVPAAMGVQEAGYAALGALFGFAPETGLAVSLLRRARDIAVGIPVLLAWQALEARRIGGKPDVA
ncbi:MAG TPA: lysylphosphatidylglycerol synthase domain-containing protein [Rhizomicrobium sp.]|nr:lysylphosphatidylglycerol synthase domain-containing protein [Rhizomicrobium sp.]